MEEKLTNPVEKIRIPDSIVLPQGDGGYETRLTDILNYAPDDAEFQRLFLGRAGESFVAAHLLRRGFNSCPLPVDTGVDLLAHRELRLERLLLQVEHELYQFQIKTTATSEYRASLPVRKIHELWHKSINLVVVFWSVETAPTAIILPPSLIRMLTSGGFEDARAPLLTTGDEVSLRVTESEGRYFLRNRDNDITEMRNRFDRIEPIGMDTSAFPPYASWSDGKGLIAIDPD